MKKLVQITRIGRNEFHDSMRKLSDRKDAVLREPQFPLELLSMYVVERVATERSAPIPECTTCGACCAYLLIVPVGQEETQRLTNYCDIILDDASEEVVIGRVLPRDEKTGWCVNLQGELGKDIGCTIYEDRPHPCREFEAGSDRCHEYRRMYGFEPQLSEKAAAAALSKLKTRGRSLIIQEVSIVESGKITRRSITIEGEEFTTTMKLKIFVLMTDGSEHEIHEYEADSEIWLENEFLGLTIEGAKELIASRLAL